MHLSALFPLEAFFSDVEAGYIKITHHESLPIAIANYTSKAQIEGHWTEATSRCRGLIFETETLEVIATGPAKFHNFGDAAVADLSPSQLCFRTTKADGSLGIGWAYRGVVGIATRGSFDSPQALHATELMSDVQRESIANSAPHDESLIYEIITPENRIIVDYGTADVLIPLGVVSNKSGLITERPAEMFCDETEITVAEAVAMKIPDDEEGYVLDLIDSGFNTIGHVKLKGALYRTLHVAKFDLHERRVFDHMKADTLDLLLAVLPDEAHAWVLEVRDRLVSASQAVYGAALNAAIVTRLQNSERKDQAKFINQNFPEIRSGVFLALDENWEKLTAWVSEQVKPEAIRFEAKEFAWNS